MIKFDMGLVEKENPKAEFWSIFAIAVLLILFILSIVLYKGFSSNWPYLFFMIIPLLACIGGGLYYGRIRFVFNGHKEIGIVTNKYINVDKYNTADYIVEYKYKNTKGKEFISKITVNKSDYQIFKEDMEIPVYVHGIFSLYKMEEVKEFIVLKEKEKKELEDKFAHRNYVCPYCGTHLKEFEDHCPNCGSNRNLLL